MYTFEEIVDDFLREAQIDYIGLWQISWLYRNNLKIQSDAEVKEKTLQVVREIMRHNIMPGNLVKGGFAFWSGTPAELLARVESEWPAKGIPQLDYAGCWFALNKP